VEDRRTTTAELLGNHVDTDLGLASGLDLAAFIYTDLRSDAFRLLFFARISR
jgi:hypothetical protein